MAPPEPDDAFERAVAAAAAADAAVVVIGLDGDWETEGRDRDHLDLPGRQVELVRAVAAAQPRTVVVVVAGAPVDLSWADEVPAVLWGWYPGQEGGRALADVLTGAVEPGGRLPCTLPRRLEDTPAFLDTPPDPGVLRYQEGVFCGHRWYDARHIEPAFPFGHGLGYTTFAIGTPQVPSDAVAPGADVVVEVPVTNTGDRAGAEVVQLYVGDDTATVRRAPTRAARLRQGAPRRRARPPSPASCSVRASSPSGTPAPACWRAEAGTLLRVGRPLVARPHRAGPPRPRRGLDRAAVGAGRRRRRRDHDRPAPMRTTPRVLARISRPLGRLFRARSSGVGVLSPRRRDTLGLSAAALAWIGGLVLVAVAGEAVVVQRVDRAPVSTNAPADEIVSPEVLEDFPRQLHGRCHAGRRRWPARRVHPGRRPTPTSACPTRSSRRPPPPASCRRCR